MLLINTFSSFPFPLLTGVLQMCKWKLHWTSRDWKSNHHHYQWNVCLPRWGFSIRPLCQSLFGSEISPQDENCWKQQQPRLEIFICHSGHDFGHSNWICGFWSRLFQWGIDLNCWDNSGLYPNYGTERNSNLRSSRISARTTLLQYSMASSTTAKRVTSGIFQDTSLLVPLTQIVHIHTITTLLFNSLTLLS